MNFFRSLTPGLVPWISTVHPVLHHEFLPHMHIQFYPTALVPSGYHTPSSRFTPLFSTTHPHPVLPHRLPPHTHTHFYPTVFHLPPSLSFTRRLFRGRRPAVVLFWRTPIVSPRHVRQPSHPATDVGQLIWRPVASAASGGCIHKSN